MAVVCLLTNTPWPWPTPAGAASARGGFPTLGTERERSGGGGAQRRSAQAKRGRLGCLLRAPGTESLRRSGFLALRGAQKMLLDFFFGWGLRAGTNRSRKVCFQFVQMFFFV